MFFEEDSHKIVQNFRESIFYISIRAPQNFVQLRHTEGSQHELKVALFHKTDQKRQKNVIFWVFFKEISNSIGPNCRECICYIFLIHPKNFKSLLNTELPKNAKKCDLFLAKLQNFLTYQFWMGIAGKRIELSSPNLACSKPRTHFFTIQNFMIFWQCEVGKI